MARLHFVKAARKKNPVAEVGESYWWLKFRYGGKRYFKTRPPRSATTQSEFLGQLWDIEDREWDTEDLAGDRGQVASELRDLAQECQDKLDNMPEQLQDAETGQLLQSRIDNLESWADDLENVEADPEERVMNGEAETTEDAVQAILDELLNCNPGVE